MLPAIGLIVGIYAVTRYAELLFRPDRHPALKVLAALALLVTLVLMASLVLSALPAESEPVGEMYRF